jgi:signal transduction histidine kinase
VEGLRRKLAREPGPLPDVTPSLDQVLRRIAQEVERIRQITHRLLKVARPPSGRRSLFDVNQVVRDIVAILAHDMKRSGIEAQFDLTEGLPPLSGDESRLAQVIMNLALNSLQAMEDGGGRLRIATSSENGSIQIEVDDSGVGIPPELLRRIYEPFFTTKPVGKGTGLGLFITHRIVTEMGGTIQVHSQPAKGTLFVVRLPRSQREARP